MTATVDLAKRMHLTKPGQVTWASPGSGKWCSDCRWFELHNKLAGNGQPQGRCGKVLEVTRKKGVLFIGQDAIACSVFEEAK